MYNFKQLNMKAENCFKIIWAMFKNATKTKVAVCMVK